MTQRMVCGHKAGASSHPAAKPIDCAPFNRRRVRSPVDRLRRHRHDLQRTGRSTGGDWRHAGRAVQQRRFRLPRRRRGPAARRLARRYSNECLWVHELTNLVIPVMRAQGHGRIINCSSVLGLVAMKWRGAYVATKFALEGLTDVLRLEMADTPIKIILLEPGPITSEHSQKCDPHFERWIDWENSARADNTRLASARLYTDSGPDTFELPAAAVDQKADPRGNAKRPKARYYVTKPTYLMGSCAVSCPRAYLTQ